MSEFLFNRSPVYVINENFVRPLLDFFYFFYELYDVINLFTFNVTQVPR